MATGKRADLVFIPLPAMGHVVAAVELAKLMIQRDDRLSITFLLMKFACDPSETTNYLDSLFDSKSQGTRIRFINLPNSDIYAEHLSASYLANFLSFFEYHKPGIRDSITRLNESDHSFRLVGLVMDMFCNTMTDVASEFGVPSYIFFPSGAAFLGLMLHLQDSKDESGRDPLELVDHESELVVPCFANPVPVRVVPTMFKRDEDGRFNDFKDFIRRFRQTNGIIVNTFVELEPYALASFPGNTPTIYPVGPILNLEADGGKSKDDIMAWLDKKPPASVVFLCFGSMGSFGPEQLHEIAHALERAGFHFLWSLRRPPPKGKIGFAVNFEDPNEALPEGFLDRTAGIGRVIGWAPQLAVLNHPAVGGFVSHCGWNSTLESIWCGVPVATWPIYAEQQLNAFQMVKELELADELALDYNKSIWEDTCAVLISAEKIERSIKSVMDPDSKVRKKAGRMKAVSRTGMLKGGTSYCWLGRFIDDVFNNGDTK